MWMTRPVVSSAYTRGWPLGAPHEVGVALILEDRHVEPPRERQQALAAFQPHDRGRRVLHRGNGVDVLRRPALAREAIQGRLERVQP